VATPTITSPAVPTQDRPGQVARRPLGFPAGEGAPGPVAVVLGGAPEAITLADVVRRLGAAGLPLCCAPSAAAVAHLRAEGVADERILLTGSTVLESVQHLRPSEDEQDRVLTALGLPAEYLLLTLQRPENTANPDVLRHVFDELRGIVADGLPVVFVAHPRTLDRLRENGLGDLVDACTVIAPQPPREFLALLDRARLVVSDSGGVQEEVSVVKKRLLVVRRSTERPEVVATFASLVPGGLRLGAAVRSALAEDPRALLGIPSPYGDGSASRVVVESIVKLVAPF
jgi:UDP-N-acetylglucosamine 2-epimerase (non-hydrolysing)